MLTSFAQGHLKEPVTGKDLNTPKLKAAVRIPKQQSLERKYIYGSDYDFRILNMNKNQ